MLPAGLRTSAELQKRLEKDKETGKVDDMGAGKEGGQDKKPGGVEAGVKDTAGAGSGAEQVSAKEEEEEEEEDKEKALRAKRDAIMAKALEKGKVEAEAKVGRAGGDASDIEAEFFDKA
jgi:hypothetical protein